MTTNCRQYICNVPDKIDTSNNIDASLLQGKDFSGMNIDLYNGRSLQQTSFSGERYSTTLGFTFYRWHRETNFDQVIAGIDFSSVSFKSATSGFVGLAPYTKDLSDKTNNFMV